MHNNTPIVPYVSLCSGYEGIGLGLHRCIPNLRCIAYCEREAFAISNLVAKMENGLLDAAPVFTDVTTFPWEQYAPYMAGGILSFGWPCQPVSCAGKRKATEDERWLFDIIADGIALMRPGLLFAENVEGLLSAKMPDGSLVFSHCIERLESLHYKVAAGIFSASEVGAPHQRKRVFILAYDQRQRIEELHGAFAMGSEQHSIGNLSAGWRRVSFASECHGGDDDEPGNECAVCGLDYCDDCQCPGPTQDGYEYAEFDGILYARPEPPWPSRPGEQQFWYEPPRVVANDHRPHAGHGEQWPERTLGDLSGGCGEEAMGNAEQFLLPASREHGAMDEASGIPTDREGCESAQADPEPSAARKREGNWADASERGQAQPSLGRDADGPAGGLGYAELCVSCDNRTDELRLLGNGVVPATATRAFVTLMEELQNNF
jgi:DNA (cytosine-5)-methyltransferase 1